MRAALKVLTIAVSLWGVAAWAAVGKVTALEGTATRTASGKAPEPVVAELEIEVGDTLEVGAEGGLQLTLTDESVLLLGPGAKLQIEEAEFKSLDDRRFTARLHLGELWAQVKRALVGSEAHFEVVTERAVAGVRGTIFEVSVIPGVESETHVGVEEGEVEVLQAIAGVAADAPREQRFKRHRIKRGEAMRVRKLKAEKRKHIRKANRFRRFVERQRMRRQIRRIERRQDQQQDRRRR